MRIHGYVLEHWYPRPDLVLMLDAPADTLVARRPEVVAESVARRREEYLSLAHVLPAFEIVTVDRPLDVVVDDVAARIVAFVDGDALVGQLETAPAGGS